MRRELNTNIKLIICISIVFFSMCMVISCDTKDDLIHDITYDSSIFENANNMNTLYYPDPDSYLLDITYEFIYSEIKEILPSGKYTVSLKYWWRSSKGLTSLSSLYNFYTYNIIFGISGDIDKVKLKNEMTIQDGELYIHKYDSDDVNKALYWRVMVTMGDDDRQMYITDMYEDGIRSISENLEDRLNEINFNEEHYTS